MPYLNPTRKAELDRGAVPLAPGDLTYLLTMAALGDPREATLTEALQAAIDRYLGRLERPRYADYNDVLGSLTATALEYTRRNAGKGNYRHHMQVIDVLVDFMQDYYTGVMGPYEDTKITENGDVYS